MPDFAVADPEEGLREQGNSNPVTPSTLGQRFLSGAATALTGSFTDLEQHFARQDTQGLYSEPRSTADEINARYPDLKVREPLPMSVASNMDEARAARVKQQNLAARYPSGFGNAALGLGADAVSGLLDPVGDAAFMIPVIGETRYAAWLARAGESAGLAGRAGVTLAVGAARGEAGQAILSAGKLGLADTGISDYHLGDAAHDLLYAPVAGALMHGALAFRGDILGTRFLESPEGRTAATNADVHDAAIRTGAAQLASGAPFDVRPVFDAAKYRTELMGGTAIEAPGLDAEAQARTDNALARAAGAPSEAEARWADESAAAQRAPAGPATGDSQLAEARAVVEQMRAAGHLTAEDEDLLARLEREDQAGGTGGDKKAPFSAPAPGGPTGGAEPTSAVTPQDIAAAQQHIAGAKAALAGAQSPTLLQAIRRAGGIALRDESGNYTPEGTVIRQILDRNNRGIINNKTGMRADYMREHLAQQGWFADHPGEELDIQHFYDAIDKEARGTPVYHPTSETGAALAAHASLMEEMDHAGITGREPIEQQARALAEDRARRTADHQAWSDAADRAGIPHAPDATPEEILADAVERDAIRAEANGSAEDFANIAESWIDERLPEIPGEPARELAEAIRNQELEHEPTAQEPGAAGADNQGGERSSQRDAGAGGAGPDGEGAAGGGADAGQVGGQLDIPGSEPSARQLAAARESSGAGRIAASGEQEPADVGLFAPPARQEPTLFQRESDDIARNGAGDRHGATSPDGKTTQELIRESASLGDVLDHIQKYSKDPMRVELARALSRTIGADVVFRHMRANEARNPDTGNYRGGFYDSARRFFTVHADLASDPEKTFLHEAIHAATVSAINRNTPTGKAITRLFNSYHELSGSRSWRSSGDQYGFSNSKEFIAEALTNPRFREVLDSIKKAPFEKSFLQRLYDMFRKLFGLKPTDPIGHIIENEPSIFDPKTVLSGAARETLAIDGKPYEPDFGQYDSPDNHYGSTAFQMTPEQSARAEQMDAAVAARQKLTAYQDLQKRMALIQAVQNFHDQTVNRPTLRHPFSGIDRKLPLATSIDALTRGISEAVKGARESTASEQLARANDFLGGLQSGLDKIPGGMEAWRKAALTKEWVRELHEMNKEGGKPGVTKSPMALEIARAVKQAQDVAKVRLNKSGAWIGDYDGYISRTQHNAVKIDQAGYQAWKTFTLARLDEARTFADLNPGGDADTFGANGSDEQRGLEIDRFLKGTWDGLSTGVHMSSQQGVGKGGAFSGPGSLGKKLSSERVLHWKDADAWREYQEKFGDPVIERGIMNGLHRAAHDAALMRRWGSNPQYTFDNLLRTVKEQYRDDHEAIRAFQGAEARLREEFAFLSGAANMPGTKLAWQIRSGILGWQDITKLGNVLFAHFSAAVTKPHQMMYHGVGRWKSYSSVIRNLALDGSDEGKQTLENLRAHATGLTQDIVSGYEPIDGVPGRISGLRMKMMRLGGLPWLLSRQKSGTEWELANFLGQRLGSEFEGLNPRTQRALKIYGLDKPEWDALRAAPDHDTDGQGLPYLTPQAAQRATDAAIDALAGQRINPGMGAADVARVREETRDRLMMKLAAYYSDSADRSTVTPGIPERAMFTRIGGRFGGPIIGQYKTWAAAAVRQLWGQSLYGSSRGEAVKALAGLVATGTAAGYLRMVAKDVAGGKNPRMLNGDPVNDAEILLSAMVQGGGLGILGDMILGQFEANAGTGRERALKYIATLAGPVIGDIADIGGVGFDYASAAFQPDPGKAFRAANAEALHLLTSHLPAVNLFYLRTLFNYLIFDRLYEMASPGYNHRYMERVKKQSAGQTFFAPPTSFLGHDSYPIH